MGRGVGGSGFHSVRSSGDVEKESESRCISLQTLPQTVGTRCNLKRKIMQILDQYYGACSAYYVKPPAASGTAPLIKHIKISAIKCMDIRTKWDKSYKRHLSLNVKVFFFFF